MKKYLALAMLVTLSLTEKSRAQEFSHHIPKEQNLYRPSLADSVKMMAEALIKKGFTAGDGYGEVWIRDLNTFIELSCKVNDPALIRKHLITFLKFQQPDGNILDGYVPAANGGGGYNYYKSALSPEYLGHKNTVETDQESSLIQAVSKYIKGTGDSSIVNEDINGLSVQKRLELSMKFLLKERMVTQYGLLWGATTADWGDVQPEHDWGVELDAKSHRSIDIYDNAMFLIAIEDFRNFAKLDNIQKRYWKQTAMTLKKNIRKYLWDKKNQKFLPHIYINGSPFRQDFDESKVYYHGGTAVAIEAGILSKKEIKTAYEKMKQNVIDAGASTIGLTLYPVYPDGSFLNKGMGAYSYQNGGDWTWFGGRMVIELIKSGYIEEAKQAIQPMLQRVIKNKGFYEWYTPSNQPKGSSSFKGEAGVLWSAIRLIENR